MVRTGYPDHCESAAMTVGVVDGVEPRLYAAAMK